MGQLIFWGILIWLGWVVATGLVNSVRNRSQTRQHRPAPRTPSHNPKTYRPSGSNKGVAFRSKGSSKNDSYDAIDAYTGRRLGPSEPFFECSKCHAFYSSGSLEVLRELNADKCMVCGLATVQRAAASTQAWRQTRSGAEQVTQHTYSSQIGRVVTYKGFVYDVRPSRNGNDYAVMLEPKSWREGLKLMAFRGSVARLGGPRRLTSMRGRSITVRGLLINHPIYGPEIIINDPSMILEVSDGH